MPLNSFVVDARDACAAELLNGAEIRAYFACTVAAALRPIGRLRG